MTFPTGTQINTTNVDSPDDDPSLARADIYSLMQAFNQLLASENTALGVCVLDGSDRVAGRLLPGTINPSGGLTLYPSSATVSIRNVLRLYPVVTSDLGTFPGTTSPSAGDLVYLTDGDAGSPCLGCYDGTAWRVVRLMTQVGDVGAALTSTASLTAEAD